jgi:hypothetical protein
MEAKDAQCYVRENLGIDIAASSYSITQKQADYVINSYPYRGILLLAGSNHLIKAGRLCYELLKSDIISGSIERFESWEIVEVSRSLSLLVLTNLSEDLIKPQSVIGGVSLCMKLHIPMMFTTPLEVEDLENSLPMSVLSNVFPYLYGKI